MKFTAQYVKQLFLVHSSQVGDASLYTNAMITGSDLTGVLEAMNATISQLVVKDMENRQAIYNLTAILTSFILENRQAIHNLTQLVHNFRLFHSCNEIKKA